MHPGQRVPEPRYSVIIPLWNEADGIQQLRESLERLRTALDRETQFVFVDDGSTDGTLDLLHEAFGADPACKVVAHGQNRGIGAAFRTGFAHATGTVVCTIDADCSYKPEGLKRLIKALDDNCADIAVASPYHPDGGVQDVPGWRLILSRGCSLLYQVLSPVRLYTYTSVFRAYRRPVVQNISFKSNGFVSAAEMIFSAAELGYRIVEVPMILHARKVGQSKMKIARTIRMHLQVMRELVCRRLGLVRSRDCTQPTVTAMRIAPVTTSTPREKE